MKVDIIAHKGSMRILHAISERETMNFSEFRRLVGSPTTTSKCLQGLVGAGLLVKEIQADRYRSVKYSLTAKGAAYACQSPLSTRYAVPLTPLAASAADNDTVTLLSHQPALPEAPDSE